MPPKAKKPPIYKKVFNDHLGTVNRYRDALRRLIAAQITGQNVEKAKDEMEYHKAILHNALESAFYVKEGSSDYILNVVQPYARQHFWDMVERNLIGGDASPVTM